MSNKQQYKQFTVNSSSDYIVYLRQLIIQVHKLMKTYNKYVENLSNVIDDLNLRENEKQSIDIEIYDDNNAKIQYLGSKLLNLFGDLATGALSYYKFRKTLIKRNNLVKSQLGTLPEEVLSILKNFNELRNWGLHEPESLLNAHLENIGKLWSPEDVQKYLSNFNPISVPYFKQIEGKWLISLYEESAKLSEGHEILYNSMLSDYSKLIEQEPVVKENHIALRSFESEIMLPITSFKMQKGKYKN